MDPNWPELFDIVFSKGLKRLTVDFPIHQKEGQVNLLLRILQLLSFIPISFDDPIAKKINRKKTFSLLYFQILKEKTISFSNMNHIHFPKTICHLDWYVSILLNKFSHTPSYCISCFLTTKLYFKNHGSHNYRIKRGVKHSIPFVGISVSLSPNNSKLKQKNPCFSNIKEIWQLRQTRGSYQYVIWLMLRRAL